MSRDLQALLSHRLQLLRDDGALRDPDQDAPEPCSLGGAAQGATVDLYSNDYLGLARGSVSRETLAGSASLPPGAGASRLIFGTHPEHVALERELADWLARPTTLLFSTGYAANVGTIAALAGPGDVILSDALNHASIIDGCRLSRARTAVYAHCDLGDLAKQLARPTDPGHRWVVTESYFSMDGDSPDLTALTELCREHNASLILDEAHALGVFGPAGSGLANVEGVHADVVVGTLGKAVGAQGAFVAGTEDLRLFLWNRARSLVFSTAPSPHLVSLTRAQVRRARAADPERNRLFDTCRRVRAGLHEARVPVDPRSHGPIVPIILGSNTAALEAAEAMRNRGFQTRAIRPPTVPKGTARLRVTLDATLDTHQIDDLVRTLSAITAPSCPES